MLKRDLKEGKIKAEILEQNKTELEQTEKELGIVLDEQEASLKKLKELNEHLEGLKLAKEKELENVRSTLIQLENSLKEVRKYDELEHKLNEEIKERERLERETREALENKEKQLEEVNKELERQKEALNAQSSKNLTIVLDKFDQLLKYTQLKEQKKQLEKDLNIEKPLILMIF